MINFFRYRIPIRVRLTLWYVMLMAVTFTIFSVYLIARFQNSLRSALDASLQITVSKTVSALDEDDYIETGKLTFDQTSEAQTLSDNFAMRILSVQGAVWDRYSAYESVSSWARLEAEYSTQPNEWRIYSQPVLSSKGEVIGWVQAAQSLQPVKETISDFREQLLFGMPLVLLLAGAGGYFLANRALSPVEQITNIARGINLHDLSKRIDYQGAMDEVGYLAHTFDLMLARLQDSFEREKRFTADVAHELRTPLTVLKGQIEVTLNRPRTPTEYENKLKELSLQVDRLIRLSNALLFLSRSDQNLFEFEPSTINLSEMLEVLIEQFQPFADEKGLKINTNIPTNIPVHGDGDHLIRLFINLLENALKYTPGGGQITVTVLNKLYEVQVIIHNSGAGIPQEHLSHLFERFYRVDEDRSSQTGGSGLGLAIAHEIVNMHKGKIEAQSESSQGVTVSVRLPLSNS